MARNVPYEFNWVRRGVFGKISGRNVRCRTLDVLEWTFDLSFYRQKPMTRQERI